MSIFSEELYNYDGHKVTYGNLDGWIYVDGKPAYHIKDLMFKFLDKQESEVYTLEDGEEIE